MLSFANPTLPEFSDDLLIAPAVVALQGHHGKPNTFSSYTTRRDTAWRFPWRLCALAVEFVFHMQLGRRASVAL